jgi:hypothetical protein
MTRLKSGVNSGALEKLAGPVPLVTHAVVLLTDMNVIRKSC